MTGSCRCVTDLHGDIFRIHHGLEIFIEGTNHEAH